MESAKFFSVMLLAMIKTLVSPPVGFAADMSFGMTFLAVAIGGLIGYCVFFYLFDFIMKLNSNISQKNRVKKIEKARKIINMRKKYPLWLFLFILPLFSIPVMSFVIRKFYCHNKVIMMSCLGIIVIWSFCSCLLFYFIILLR